MCVWGGLCAATTGFFCRDVWCCWFGFGGWLWCVDCGLRLWFWGSIGRGFSCGFDGVFGCGGGFGCGFENGLGGGVCVVDGFEGVVFGEGFIDSLRIELAGSCDASVFGGTIEIIVT